MNRTTEALQIPTATRQWMTWTAAHAGVALLAGVAALVWLAAGAQVLVVTAGLTCLVRGGVDLLAARRGAVSLARTAAAEVVGGLAAVFAGLLSGALSGALLVAASLVVPLALAARPAARTAGTRWSVAAWAGVLLAAEAVAFALGGADAVVGTVTVVGAALAVVAGVFLARTARQLGREARRPAVPAACAGCACSGGGCGVLR